MSKCPHGYSWDRCPICKTHTITMSLPDFIRYSQDIVSGGTKPLVRPSFPDFETAGFNFGEATAGWTW